MNKHILYSFRRCPYAIRARWALRESLVKVELREVDLKNKPVDLIKNSQNKTVPLLILKNGEIIEESNSSGFNFFIFLSRLSVLPIL